MVKDHIMFYCRNMSTIIIENPISGKCRPMVITEDKVFAKPPHLSTEHKIVS